MFTRQLCWCEGAAILQASAWCCYLTHPVGTASHSSVKAIAVHTVPARCCSTNLRAPPAIRQQQMSQQRQNRRCCRPPWVKPSSRKRSKLQQAFRMSSGRWQVVLPLWLQTLVIGRDRQSACEQHLCCRCRCIRCNTMLCSCGVHVVSCTQDCVHVGRTGL